jgi:hypothetical protein
MKIGYQLKFTGFELARCTLADWLAARLYSSVSTVCEVKYIRFQRMYNSGRGVESANETNVPENEKMVLENGKKVLERSEGSHTGHKIDQPFSVSSHKLAAITQPSISQIFIRGTNKT